MTAKKRRIAAALALALLVVGTGAWFAGADNMPAESDPGDPRLVARGKVVYVEHCASCHGANLEGQPNWRHRLPNGRWPAPPQDASGHTWHHPDKVLFEVTKFGMRVLVPGRETDMPGFEGVVADADIWAVLSFIESTWSPQIRERQRRMSEKARSP